MKQFDRLAVILAGTEVQWLDVGTRKQLHARGWFKSEIKDREGVNILPVIQVRFEPKGKFKRVEFVDALNRSLADFVLGEMNDPEYLSIAVIDGLDRLYLSIFTYCGQFPDTLPPAPPYLAGLDIVPEWGTPEAIAALTALYDSTVGE